MSLVCVCVCVYVCMCVCVCARARLRPTRSGDEAHLRLAERAEARLPHKIVNMIFQLAIVNNKLTISWGS